MQASSTEECSIVVHIDQRSKVHYKFTLGIRHHDFPITVALNKKVDKKNEQLIPLMKFMSMVHFHSFGRSFFIRRTGEIMYKINGLSNKVNVILFFDVYNFFF